MANLVYHTLTSLKREDKKKSKKTGRHCHPRLNVLFVEIIHHGMRMRDPDGVQVNLIFQKYFLLECHRTRELIAVIKMREKSELMQLFLRLISCFQI